MFDVLHHHLRMRLIPGMTNDCAQFEHLFKKSGTVLNVLHLVHITVVLYRRKESGIKADDLFPDNILGEGERKSEEKPPLPLLIDNRSLSHLVSLTLPNLFSRNLLLRFRIRCSRLRPGQNILRHSFRSSDLILRDHIAPG